MSCGIVVHKHGIMVAMKVLSCRKVFRRLQIRVVFYPTTVFNEVGSVVLWPFITLHVHAQ